MTNIREKVFDALSTLIFPRTKFAIFVISASFAFSCNRYISISNTVIAMICGFAAIASSYHRITGNAFIILDEKAVRLA
jgi:hypothetical protein